MRVLITGAKGFVGKNLCAALRNIRDNKDRRFPELKIEEIFEYDIDSKPEELDAWCKEADFVFNLAGVNRPQNQEEFMQGNFGFASTLLDTLKKHKNTCPVMLSSSQQASLTGRFGNSEYGRSKKAGEDLFLEYGKETGAEVHVYRFPNLFGKWCRPNYNSAVATFCNAFANDLPYTVNDPSVELELLYIDDLVDEMLAILQGKEHRCEFNGLEVIPTDNIGQELENLRINSQTNEDTDGTDKSFSNSQILDKKIGRYCYVPTTHKATLGEIVELLKSFAEQPKTLMIDQWSTSVATRHSTCEHDSALAAPSVPEFPDYAFAKKLYATYLSYLPKEKVAFPLKMNVDDRGSFTELLHTVHSGQVSINISKPGITKGQHWHNTKWEFFIVVAGHGLIQERKLGSDEVIEFEVSGDNIQCIHMLPGYTHNIINLSDTENLVTVMYCNEIFDPNRPDTFFEPVK